MTGRKNTRVHAGALLASLESGHVYVYRLIVRAGYELLASKGYSVREVHERYAEDGKFLADWRTVSKTALDRIVKFDEASKRDMYDVGRYVLSELDATDKTEKPNTVDWYPDGWKDAAKVMRGEIQRVAEAEMTDEERQKLLAAQVRQLQAERAAAE